MRHAWTRWLIVLMGVGLVTGCHTYHWYKPSKVLKLHVPFAKNDGEGALTAEVIEALGQNGFLMDKSAPLVIEIDLANTRLSSINYNYGYDEQGEPTSALYATGSRMEWSCTVAVKDRRSKEYVIKPQTLKASSEFDYQSDEMPYNEVQFSVGQLNIKEEALGSAQRYLAKKMAQAIASWLVVHQAQLKL